MLQYNFKDKYTSADGTDILRLVSPIYYLSPSYVGGNGTRLSPVRSSNYIPSMDGGGLILSGGYHKGTIGFNSESRNGSILHVNGENIGKTILNQVLYTRINISNGYGQIRLRDLTVEYLNHSTTIPYNGSWRIVARYVEFLSMPVGGLGGGQQSSYIDIARCKFKVVPTTYAGIAITLGNNNSFIDINSTIGALAGSLHTFEKCNLIINQASLDTYKSNYYAFDNCNFRIGTETEYTPLTGTTAEELRGNFVTRCTAAGLIVPNVTDYGITLPAGRWIFTKNQVFEGITWKGSEINVFEVLRFISFGYSASRGDKIPVTASKNIPASFTPNNPHSAGLSIANDSLSISSDIDITKRNNIYIDSKIIWPGGKKKLTKIDIPNDLPYQYGVLIDCIPNLLCDTGQEVTQIEAGEMYIVRSLDENAASVTYKGSTYSSALSSRNNIFKGVADATSFVIASGRAVVYKINDILNYQSIQMRIVNKIPSELKKTGNLTPNYWYLVEHDSDQNNTTDYITYNGVNYKAGDSFVCQTGSLTFTTTGSTHLRRCWDKDFNFDTEVTDKAFWQNEQKPDWFDVLPEDPRCLLKNNHPLSIEMQRGEDGKYIASGHPEYYNKILGASGIQAPNDIFLSGTYMQIRLQITTVNPM